MNRLNKAGKAHYMLSESQLGVKEVIIVLCCETIINWMVYRAISKNTLVPYPSIYIYIYIILLYFPSEVKYQA